MKLATVAFLVALPFSTLAQAAFQNLDFESANLSPVQNGGEVSITAALPGRSAEIDGMPVTQVLQNDYNLGAASIDIFTPTWNEVNPGIIDGNDTAYLQPGFVGQGGLTPANASVFQVGTIPENSESLQLKAWNTPAGSSEFTVSFAGNILSPFVLSTGESPSGQSYTLYGFDVAPYEQLNGC